MLLSSNLFYDSLTIGKFPDCLKTARKIPLIKWGDKLALSNYWSISTLPTPNSMLLWDHHLLSRDQFALRAGLSTSSTIITFLNCDYGALSTQRCVMSISMDILKTFDTINQEKLLSKMSHFKFNCSTGDYVDSNLLNRSQFVPLPSSEKWNNIFVRTGVPRGSIEGTLFFLNYNNDMLMSAQDLQFTQLEVDSTIYTSSYDIANSTRYTNNVLEGIDVWFKLIVCH